LVHIYKTTYIFCKSIIHKNNSFSVSRILTLAALDSWLELYIGEPIEVSNPDTILQTLVSLDYAIEPYTLWHIYFPRAHTLHYSCLSLVKYSKLLLDYHLGLGSYHVRFIIARMYLLFSLVYSLLLYYHYITNPFYILPFIY
jgi:hypothetical protein